MTNINEFEDEVVEQGKQICTASGKVMYSKREAGELINNMKRHLTFSRLGKSGCNRPKRMYLCPVCGTYHVTHLGEQKQKKPLKELYR